MQSLLLFFLSDVYIAGGDAENCECIRRIDSSVAVYVGVEPVAFRLEDVLVACCVLKNDHCVKGINASVAVNVGCCLCDNRVCRNNLVAV